MATELHTGMRVAIKWLPEIPAEFAGQRGTLDHGPIMPGEDFPPSLRLQRNVFAVVRNATNHVLWVVALDKGIRTAAPEHHIIPLDDDGEANDIEKEKSHAD